MGWRTVRYRLMKLSASGRVYEQAGGSLAYLVQLATQAKATRGRQWIERSDQPATVQTSAAYRITQHVLATTAAIVSESARRP